MGRRHFSSSVLNDYGKAWLVMHEKEVDTWLRRWDHDGLDCECDACVGIIISLHWILAERWPSIELTRIVGWLRFNETADRKDAPSIYRRKATRIKGWDRRKIERAIAMFE
jgi:hypothetical protein